MISKRVDIGTPVSRISRKGSAVLVEGEGLGMFGRFSSGYSGNEAVNEEAAEHAEHPEHAEV